jgi:hypothetical protein
MASSPSASLTIWYLKLVPRLRKPVVLPRPGTGRPSTSRLLSNRLSSGDVLVVGRDLQDVNEIEQLVLRRLPTHKYRRLHLNLDTSKNAVSTAD